MPIRIPGSARCGEMQGIEDIAIFENYVKSLKALEAEEVFDLFFYRPLAHPIVIALARTPVTPNQVTLVAFLLTAVTGICFLSAGSAAILAGGLIYLVSRVLDCVDGQLARAKGTGSKLGKLYDGLADYFGHAAVMTGFAFAIGKGDLSAPIALLPQVQIPAWIATLLASASLIYQCILADKYKNEYLSRKFPNRKPPSEELREFEEERGKARGMERLLLGVFIGYLKLQNKPSTQAESVTPPAERELYCRMNKVTLFAWNLLGPSMHANLIIVLSILNRLDLYVPAAVVFMNAASLPMHAWQWFVNRSLAARIAAKEQA